MQRGVDIQITEQLSKEGSTEENHVDFHVLARSKKFLVGVSWCVRGGRLAGSRSPSDSSGIQRLEAHSKSNSPMLCNLPSGNIRSR